LIVFFLFFEVFDFFDFDFDFTMAKLSGCPFLSIVAHPPVKV